MQTKADDATNLKTMPKGLSASLPDLDSESWIEVKKRPRPSPSRSKVSRRSPQLSPASLYLYRPARLAEHLYMRTSHLKELAIGRPP